MSRTKKAQSVPGPAMKLPISHDHQSWGSQGRQESCGQQVNRATQRDGRKASRIRSLGDWLGRWGKDWHQALTTRRQLAPVMPSEARRACALQGGGRECSRPPGKMLKELLTCASVSQGEVSLDVGLRILRI